MFGKVGLDASNITLESELQSSDCAYSAVQLCCVLIVGSSGGEDGGAATRLRFGKPLAAASALTFAPFEYAIDDAALNHQAGILLMEAAVLASSTPWPGDENTTATLVLT